jgi:sulfide dehydrogenase cytochrome subunit
MDVMRKTVRLAVCVAFLGLQTGYAQTLDSVLQGCAQCHGPTGISQTPGTPHLEHQLTEALEEALNAYAQARRSTKIREHKEVPEGLRPAIAKFYNAQKSNAWPPQTVDAARVAQGEPIYSARCAKCHDDSGRESANDASLLAGQDLEYLIGQTKAFKSGGRPQPSMMDRAYKDLSDADLEAVAHYFASQDAAQPGTGKKKRRRNATP